MEIKPQVKLLHEFLMAHPVETVLDIGAGRGYESLLCASYGAQVDAVDPLLHKRFLFPQHLRDHPKIQFYELMIHDFLIEKKYDLVLLNNVLMFINKDYVLHTLLPKLAAAMNQQGTILITFFYPYDCIIENNKSLTLYEVEDFEHIPLATKRSEEKRFTAPHPDHGTCNHHHHYLVLQKI